MKYIGKGIEYFTHDGTKRVGTITKIEFHQQLKKPLFTCISPYGNVFRLSRDEIHKVL